MRLCLVVLLLCTPAFAKRRPAKPKPKPAACGKTWAEAKTSKFKDCPAWPEVAHLFTAANTEGDTLFKAVAAVCYAKGGDPRMSACLPNGDQCPAGKTEPQCLEAWFQCCLEGR